VGMVRMHGAAGHGRQEPGIQLFWLWMQCFGNSWIPCALDRIFRIQPWANVLVNMIYEWSAPGETNKWEGEREN
jgi:hypothetical protein